MEVRERRKRFMLGDWVADRIASFGITAAKYEAFRERHGMLPECNCEARRQWLNNFGQEFGHKTKKLLKFLLR